MVDSTDNSNQMVVKQEHDVEQREVDVVEREVDVVERDVEVAAPPEEVWEALATDEGRERWLEPDPSREIRIEAVEQPHRLVWWWWSDDAPPRRVEILIVAAPAGSRVIVSESAPSFPLELMASGLSRALAPA
jgi:uncharacterized protein YndB with AHSA1/START domain